VPEDMEVVTHDFKVVTTCAFVTGAAGGEATNFLKGATGAGIPPKASAQFSVAGDNFLASITLPQFERGIILRFQSNGREGIEDIAIFADKSVLFSLSDPIYQIYKTR